jgi:hypothetical protein
VQRRQTECKHGELGHFSIGHGPLGFAHRFRESPDCAER